ncbi:MAG: hypothetical protein AB7E49_01160 [Campylobacterales bacterium]
MKMLKTVLAVFLGLGISASLLHAASVTKKGVLVTEACVAEGRFVECPLSSYTLDSKLVLFVHEDLKHYALDLSKIPQRELDGGFARNGVEIVGQLVPGKNLLIADQYKSPPPPVASTFKG